MKYDVLIVGSGASGARRPANRGPLLIRGFGQVARLAKIPTFSTA